MNSRKEKSEITTSQIDQLVTQLKKIAANCTYYPALTEEQTSYPTHKSQNWPLDPKLNPLPLIGAFDTETFYLELYVKTDLAFKNKKYQEIKCYPKQDSGASLTKKLIQEHKIVLPDWRAVQGTSIPIWEEIVHRFPAINRFIKQTAPDNPWTLYKTAQKEFHKPEYQIQLGGFPQWLINDVDFRKIKKLEFLLEFKLQENCSLYYFYDHDINESVMISQKL
jgi:hypothetical protein